MTQAYDEVHTLRAKTAYEGACAATDPQWPALGVNDITSWLSSTHEPAKSPPLDTQTT